MNKEVANALERLIAEADENGMVEDTSTLDIPDGLMSVLGEKGYVTNYIHGCSIETKGRLALSEFQQNAKEMTEKAAKEEAEKREDKAEQRALQSRGFRFNLLNTIVGAIAGALLTLFIEHFDTIVKIFQK